MGFLSPYHESSENTIHSCRVRQVCPMAQPQGTGDSRTGERCPVGLGPIRWSRELQWLDFLSSRF